MDVKLSEIGQIAVTVSDVGTALVFYRDVLASSLYLAPSPTSLFLRAGSILIMLSTPQGAGAVGANSILYFRVSELGKVFTSIVARGATSERAPQLTAKMPDHELWMAFVRDPDENLVGLMEEKR